MKIIITILTLFISLSMMAQKPMFYALQNNYILPSQSNIKAWYIADLGVTGTTAITAWADQSGNGYTLTNQTGSEPVLYPNFKNGHAAIKFSGSAQRLINASFSQSQPSTVFVVAKDTISNAGAGNCFFDSYNSVQSALFVAGAGATLNIASGTTVIGPGFTPNKWYVMMGLFNNTSSDVLEDFTSPAFNKSAGTNAISGISIGQLRGDPTPVSIYYLNGYVLEIVVYNKALSKDEVVQAQNYLGNKYAIF